jgi:S1-C subfamily serine protease
LFPRIVENETMTRHFAFVALLVAGCGLNGSSKTTDYRFGYEETLRAATVYIQGCGTGWLVTERFVVTNAHIADCIKDRHNGYAQVDFLDGSSMKGEEVGRSTQEYVDLALIKLSGAAARNTLALGQQNTTLPKDTLLMSMGNPAPSKWIPTTYRVIVQPASVPGGLNGVIVMEGSAYYGDSGSPVTTLDGRVVGVVFARTEGHVYAVPVQPYLVDLLQEVMPNPPKHTWP